MVLLVGLACTENVARKPIQQKTGSFYQISAQRSKKRLAFEEKIINQLIAADTITVFKISNNGYWYNLEQPTDSTAKILQPNDEVFINYQITNLKGDTLYSKEEIGLVPVKIDKTKLFPGLRYALKQLKPGGVGNFIFPSSLAYGYKGDNNKIVPHLPLKVQLKVVKRILKKDSTQVNNIP